MIMSSRTVHVLSMIPQLKESLLRSQIPASFKFVNIKDDPSKRYGKKVTTEEISELRDAEILLADAHLFAQVHDVMPRLQWVQSTWAGVEGLVRHFRSKPKPSYLVTRFASQAFSRLMAEYVVGQIISHERAWTEVHANQLAQEWDLRGKTLVYRSLAELCIGVLGVGAVGREVIKALKSFQCTVHGLGRRQKPDAEIFHLLDKYWHMEQLSSFLKECDYVVNVLPSTPMTQNLLAGSVLKDATKNPVFVNVGRGDIIPEADLIHALDQGWLSWAILDVYPVEPLPKSSLLWLHPKVLLTPHVAAVSRPKEVAECFAENYSRFVNQNELLYQIDWNAGY